MRFRKLRIALPVVWGLACVLLIVLWVRSYQWLDNVQFPTSGPVIVISYEGIFGLTYYPEKHETGYRWVLSVPGDNIQKPTRPGPASRWGFFSNAINTSVHFPHWFGVLIFAVLAATPWARQIPWRFTLRTLLIATTLVAVGLGLIVWLSHH
jgi:hypothetical protein